MTETALTRSGIAPTPATAATFTAVEIIQCGRELCREIQANGAKSIHEAALPALIQTLQGAKSDLVLSGIDFDGMAPETLLNYIAFTATPFQRFAFSAHLTPQSALYFPAVYGLAMANSKSLKIVVDFLKNSMFSLAGHFGVSFSGDPDSVAHTILKDFGGFSIADFLIFFDACKSGRYRQESQHVASRGINYDFLKTWLDEYAVEREAAWRGIHAQYGQPVSGSADESAGVNISEIRQQMERRKAEIQLIQAQRNEIELKASDLRRQWEDEIFETKVITQWFKTIDGNEMLCDESDSQRSRSEQYPVRVHRPGGVERLMKRTIFEYITFGDADMTLHFFEQLKSIIAKKYEGELDAEKYHDAEMKALLSQIQKLQREMSVLKMAEYLVRKDHPDASDRQVSATVSISMEEMERFYFENYLPDCINGDYPPLKQAEMAWQIALHHYVESGKQNPVKTLIFE